MTNILAMISGLLILMAVGSAIYDAVKWPRASYLWLGIIALSIVAVMHFYLHVGAMSSQ